MTTTEAPPGSLPGTARAARPQERTAQRRRAILDAATRVFGERGYNNGSLVEIAEIVGITHAGVLHHFGSKEQLLLAVLAHRDEVDIERLATQQRPVGAEFLSHLVATAQANTERSGIVQTYAVLAAESVTGDHPAQEFFRGRFAVLRGDVADALGLTVGAPASDERVVAAASAIIAVMDGLQVQWLLDAETVAMPDTLRFVIDAIVESLRRSVAATP
ncbi:AcrR family transcriptional regulator [Conyzicola lurida]|uniref:AcrR family transcriptional regulator n=1 Tax=Conyzicola lurida TaxID=1172621 RepID=A0A841ARG5_9MICO|nr:TetR/AcrR family transcriptional regulator [Conyzicola lurida]MBB5844173.1 AcrR family transcriptional regulator [Conyzicola lurida]